MNVPLHNKPKHHKHHKRNKSDRNKSKKSQKKIPEPEEKMSKQWRRREIITFENFMFRVLLLKYVL